MGRRRATVEESLGEAIRWYRERGGLSQEALGLEAGSGRTYVSEIERGVKNPSVATLFKLAGVLRVRPSEIVRRAERRLGHR